LLAALIALRSWRRNTLHAWTSPLQPAVAIERPGRGTVIKFSFTVRRKTMLVRSLFAIDPTSPEAIFEGFHDPTERWDIWATPRFERRQVDRIIAWVMNAPEEGERLQWDGDVLVHDTGIDEPGWQPIRFTPDARGRYGIGSYSWTWHEIAPGDDR
jgi:hypothetical protein